ncbi:MAG: penicillin-binding protein activator [Sphingomonadaceae bacterium]|nr:penicillin-binding protein activator [Sphingomonadaceae bacterium]
MFVSVFDWRKVAVIAMSAVLAACAVVPKSTGPDRPSTTGPSSDVLPTDSTRHRIALLVPMTGKNAAVGQSIANASTMALLDTNAANLRVTTYDTSANPADAARRAVRDGNKLILGPLLSTNIPAVVASARAANVPLISFSNDEGAATRNVFVMGNLPSHSVKRTVKYAINRGITSFAALVPRGEYGQRASDALMQSARAAGGSVQAMEAYDRSTASITAAARRLQQKGGYGAVLIADGGRMSRLAAPFLKPLGSEQSPRILGTELWSGEKLVTSSKSLENAWFSAVSDARFGQFSRSYKRRFGATPYRIATLGYDAVLLTLRIASDWRLNTVFPTARLTDKDGFLGLDGPFRFSRSGAIERALEVREIRAGGITTISPAPSRFKD